MNEEPRTASVAAPPPRIFSVALTLGLALGQLLPPAHKRARFGRMPVGAAVVAGLVANAVAMYHS